MYFYMHILTGIDRPGQLINVVADSAQLMSDVIQPSYIHDRFIQSCPALNAFICTIAVKKKNAANITVAGSKNQPIQRSISSNTLAGLSE